MSEVGRVKRNLFDESTLQSDHITGSAGFYTLKNALTRSAKTYNENRNMNYFGNFVSAPKAVSFGNIAVLWSIDPRRRNGILTHDEVVKGAVAGL